MGSMLDQFGLHNQNPKTPDNHVKELIIRIDPKPQVKPDNHVQTRRRHLQELWPPEV